MITRKYTHKDEIIFFDEEISIDHQDYNPDWLDNLYKLEEKHFWFIARKEFLLGRFQKYIDRQCKIIEIGAGTGNVTRYLMSNGYTDICVGEMQKNGLEYARSYGIKGLYQFDLLNAPFKNEFEVVGMFDVLEHIENDDLALQNVHNMLQKDGKIILTVPAHQWLWNRDDITHKRRYVKKDLKEKLARNGFKILETKYYFITIMPLLLLRRLLNPDRGDEQTNSGYISMTIYPVVNNILRWVCRWENCMFDFIPNLYGGSLYAIAEKTEL